MHSFALKKIEAIKGGQIFYSLVKNDCCTLSHFENELEEKYKSEFRSIIAYMDLVANGQSLPSNKFKDITPVKSDIKEYEFKSKHLRIYCIHLKKTGKIVACCGYKNQQKNDIKKFRSTKNIFVNELEKIEYETERIIKK